MNKLFSGAQLHWVDQIALLAGRRLDLVYASLVHQLRLSPGFFRQGWGDLGVVNFEEDAKLFKEWPPPHFDQRLQWQKLEDRTLYGVDCQVLEVKFRTPCHGRVYDALPPESKMASARLLQPTDSSQQKACVLHLAGTGDHSWGRRMKIGAPLLKQGIATMVLESPFYGARRPHYQFKSQLLRVSDLLTLGRATIEESLCLLDWASRHAFPRLGMCGFSMGGVHASMVASLYPGPVACTPLLAPRSAAGAFCHGALRSATSWTPLAAAVDEKQQEIEATLSRSAQSAEGLLEAARILSSLKAARQTGHTTPSDGPLHHTHPTTAAFADNIAQQAEAQVQKSSDRQQRVQKHNHEPHMVQADSNRKHHEAQQQTAAGADGQHLHYQATAGSKRKGSDRSNAGIDAAESELGELWRLRRKLAQDEACLRLNQVLETYTDVTRFRPPRCTKAAVLVGATQDAYVSPQSVLELAEHWPGSEVRWVKGGHVSAFLLQQNAFRQAISDSISRLDDCPEQLPNLAAPGSGESDASMSPNDSAKI